MASVEILAGGGDKKKAGSLELDPVVFEAPVKAHLFHAEVRRQLSKRRAGTHSSKNRSAVSGGGAKPYRQKGTGRARQGTIRAPQYAGGGAVFGPVPRKHEHQLTKKLRRAALRAAVSLRQREGDMLVVDEIAIQEFKTRRVLELLSGIGVSGESALIVIAEPQVELERSARNLRDVNVIRVEGLNVYDVLRHGKLVLSKDAVVALERRLGAGGEVAS
jgi:large subunit ribosomal protein L4